MFSRRERGLWELYQEDPEKADAEIWESGYSISRRGFFKKGGTALAALLGAQIAFLEKLPKGLLPVALAEAAEPFEIPGKNGLVVLNDRPVNAETPAHLLDDEITPVDRHFVRNNGLPPDVSDPAEIKGWVLTIDGEVHKPLKLTLDQLKRFPKQTLQLTVECGGNGRAGFYPPAKGNQWTFGAVASPRYTGVRLKDVLEEAGLKSSAVYTGYYGKDLHLSGDPNRIPISRGTPIQKALDPHTLITFEMNGKPLPALHGFPLRLVTPGWPGSTSIKWLKRIWVRDREHDGPKMTGYAYRIPKYPVEPGAHVPKSDMQIIESMPVKSLITFPKSGLTHQTGKPLIVRGHAWAGDLSVRSVDLSIDFGATWIKTQLKPPVNPFAWQHWHTSVVFPGPGYYEVWARATDSANIMQPMVMPGWNPKGYLNNAMHRIAVRVT